MWESIRINGSWQGEILDRRKNGENYPEQLTITAVKGEHGEIINYVATIHDITSRKASEAQIRNLAFYDPLTQLPNRRLFDDRLLQAMVAGKRSGRYAALIVLDLDNFKLLNDTHGHMAGDLLLSEAANRLKGCVRELDTVARFGGDEFVVVLGELDLNRDSSIAQARLIAEKIRNNLAKPYQLTISHGDNDQFSIEHHCTVSVGVMLFIGHEERQSDILKWADVAMYKAKAAGRNQVCFHQAISDDSVG